MLKNCRTYQFLFLIFTTSLLSNFAIAQSTAEKDAKDKNQMSLFGLSEAILIDGQPALRITSRKSTSTEIKLQKRDEEDALVFSVYKVIFRNSPEGKLFVTKTKVIFVSSNNKDFSSFEKAKIEKFDFKEGGGLKLSTVRIKYNGDETKIIVLFDGEADNNSMKAVGYFLYRAIENFDETLAEFSKLTESVRPKDEEEEIEEETEADVNDKYDRFKDITVVSTTKMLVRGNKRSIRTYAEYNFAGKTQKKPEKVSL